MMARITGSEFFKCRSALRINELLRCFHHRDTESQRQRSKTQRVWFSRCLSVSVVKTSYPEICIILPLSQAARKRASETRWSLPYATERNPRCGRQRTDETRA